MMDIQTGTISKRPAFRQIRRPATAIVRRTGPHRGEKQVRRPAGRLLQSLVPVAGARNKGARARREDGGGDEASKSDD